MVEAPPDLEQTRRTAMAAERTWLAWWRTALGASAGALVVGGVAPEVLEASTWPYILLGCGYGVLAIGLLVAGAQRQRTFERAQRAGTHVPLPFRTVAAFTAGGVVLALATMAFVLTQT
jgi:putative membrane protein